MAHVAKKEVFDATAPPLVDARYTSKSYMIAYEILRELRHRNPESLVEVAFKNEKGLLKDLAKWCEVTGNELLSSESSDDGKEMRCLIQKSLELERDRNRREIRISNGSDGQSLRGDRARGSKMRSICLLISTVDLDALILPLDEALAGIVMGMDVHVCFGGIGVRVLKKGFRARCAGILSRFFSTRLESTIEQQIGGPLPSRAIEILEELGAHLYVCGPSLKEFGMKDEDIMVKSVVIASTMTWIALMAQSDVNISSTPQWCRP